MKEIPSKVERFFFLRNVSVRNTGIREVAMTIDYIWQESYLAALLETDWKKMRERLQAAEQEIGERQRVLSEDHGGTAEERQAIIDATNAMKMLHRDVVEWEKQQSPSGSQAQPA